MSGTASASDDAAARHGQTDVQGRYSVEPVEPASAEASLERRLGTASASRPYPYTVQSVTASRSDVSGSRLGMNSWAKYPW